MEKLRKKMETLRHALEINTRCNWDDNDPIKEFETLETMAQEVLALIPNEEDERIETAKYYLSDTYNTVAEQLEKIDAQAEIDGSVMLDSVDDVLVWQKLEWSMTVNEFLNEID